ncbi:membrane-bound polysaccharide biosynthesis protein [Streptomyces spiroverticillatus]|uniref:Membrane-bound polysaccharide biosynthesis protein n=1 Tax=Streptomyces finlayi TaxID=67296 RepID=A0A918X458_9ACTN|nr:Wzz/FepE/Etk N-terminal domain-containing protein [Streptomyces finlayi]GHA27346.1 membrane-bound polysaccharide biosynthesis protein [Streptomyces spiroverticillatus]GHD08505.1 membrane-bound polysaccharide biosynthesis protein [Streptomyces finlayi]
MSDDTIRLATVGRMLRRRWRLLAVLTLVGALVGYGVSVVFPPRYTATASVLLPGQWEQRELLTQVDIATSSVVVDRTAAALGWSGVDGEELRKQVAASAADGNIIKISGAADTPERAQRLSDVLARQFVTFAARISGGSTDSDTEAEALRQQVVQTNRRISELSKAADPGRSVESVQARTSLERLRTTLEKAMEKLDQADPANNKADLVVMGPAARPVGQTPPTRLHFIAAGAVLFFLLAVIGHLTVARANRRLRTGPEIAAALGSALLGTVDVPEEANVGRSPGRGPLVRMSRLLGTDTRWDVPPPQRSGDDADRSIRYRRVRARLRDQLPPNSGLLVLVPDEDPVADRAAGQLVAEATKEPDGAAPALRVVKIAVGRPTVPDREAESGALVVLGAGNWTAEDLSGIADACADSSHDLVGVVVAGTVRGRPARTSTAAPGDDSTPAPLPVSGTGSTGGTKKPARASGSTTGAAK